MKLLGPVWTSSTMSYEARCPDCGTLAYFVTAEAVFMHKLKIPVLVPHDCPLKEVTGL